MKEKATRRWVHVGVVGLTILAVCGCGTGSAGSDGEDGEDGAQGKQGEAGEDGAQGEAGDDGERGKAGNDGSKGEDGADGSDGENGADGSEGEDGADGVDGTVGPFRLPPNGHAMQMLSSFKTGGLDESASEIVAYHPASQRVFVVNAARAQVQILSLNAWGLLSDTGLALDPGADISGFDAGGVNSVAIQGDLIVVVTENASKTMAGKAAIYDATNLALISSVDVGALPDMVTFSPDGAWILVANEGEQERIDEGEAEEFHVVSDPAGSVSLIDLAGGAEFPVVSNLEFSAFDARLKEFRAKGVRYIPGELATSSAESGERALSDDLEPEYIAVSMDSTRAMVTLQENNALAVIDLEADPPAVLDLRPLGIKDFSRDLPVITNIPIGDAHRPVILADVETSTGTQDLRLGGLSALFFEGESNDIYTFATIPDRGPQIDPADLNAEHAGDERPHVMGDTYQAQIYRYEIDASDEEEVEVVGLPDQVPLFHDSDDDGNCTPVRGLANDDDLDAGEFAVNLSGTPLGYAPLDGDFEGLAADPDGDGYWLVDEYRPAIYFFSTETSGCSGSEHGLMQYRLVPQGTEAAAGQLLSVWDAKLSVAGESLPSHYLQRRANRGFEAMAIDPGTETLYAFIQSPLDYAGARSRDVIRILAVDIDETSADFGKPVAEYLYFLEGSDLGGVSDKIGDAVFDQDSGRILVVERDSSFGGLGNKSIFEIDLRGATNVLGVDDSAARFETLEVDELLSTYGVSAATKRKILNLPALGYTAGDKPEGLALVTEGALSGSLMVLNDNDFGLEPELENGKLVFSTSYEKPVFGLIEFAQKNGLDASDRDGTINIAHHPVFGMYMPDAIVSYSVGNETYFVTANEGDSRDYDESRVRSLDNDSGLDASFGTVADSDYGRLKLSIYDGDRDYDGDIDDIHIYGTRSMSIWDSLGNLVWDSGSLIEEVTATLLGDNFNSTNDENMSFDDRSDDKGPEPEGLALGKIGDRNFAFLGLERVSGIMIFDITEPSAPKYVDYVTGRFFGSSVDFGLAGDLGPEGLTFVPALESPTQMPLLIVGNEVSGTTTVFQIDL